MTLMTALFGKPVDESEEINRTTHVDFLSAEIHDLKAEIEKHKNAMKNTMEHLRGYQKPESTAQQIYNVAQELTDELSKGTLGAIRVWVEDARDRSLTDRLTIAKLLERWDADHKKQQEEIERLQTEVDDSREKQQMITDKNEYLVETIAKMQDEADEESKLGIAIEKLMEVEGINKMLSESDCESNCDCDCKPEFEDWLSIIFWSDVNDELPDDDITVLIAQDDANEPVWLGYRDGDFWRDVSGTAYINKVTHWADLPELPKRKAK
jgi:hypothetical protein